MKDMQYPNAVYDNVAAALYVQYNKSTSESNMVGNLHNVILQKVMYTILIQGIYEQCSYSKSMQLWIRLCLG